MAELLKTKEAELTTADLAGYGIPPKHPEGPKLVKGQEPETLDRVAAVSEPSPCFLNQRWASSDRGGAKYRLLLSTSHTGRSKTQTSW